MLLGSDITRSNETSCEIQGLRLIVPLSTLSRTSLLKIQQAFNIIYVEHSSACWLPAERIMLQASFLQPTGQLNLDLPNNGTKIHSCVTILHRRHGKKWLILFSSNHLWCLKLQFSDIRTTKEGICRGELIKRSSVTLNMLLDAHTVCVWHVWRPPSHCR